MLLLGSNVLTGELLMTAIIERFYTRIDNDSDADFRNMFTHNAFEQRVSNLTDFILQRFGGPSYYSDQRGNYLSFHSRVQQQ
jgi:truncated hemoglobin YjbI